MGVNLIPNQLVKLFDANDFNVRNNSCTWDDRVYCQVVREEQTTMFQVEVTAEDDVDLLTNGDFNSSGTGWNVQTPGWLFSGVGQALGSSIGGLGAHLNQTIPARIPASTGFEPQSYYCVEFNIDSFSGDVQVLVDLATVPNAGNENALAVREPGTYRVYLESLTSTSVIVSLLVSPITFGASGHAIFDYVHFIKLTTPVVTIENLAGVTQRTLTPFAREQDRINYAIDWLGLTVETSYQVCLTGVDDLTFNFLDFGLALGTEGGAAIALEEGGFLKYYG